MFKELIEREVREGPKTTAQLHELAREEQPGDCVRGFMSPSGQIRKTQEWQHQLRREQQELKRDGKIFLKDGKWQAAADQLVIPARR